MIDRNAVRIRIGIDMPFMKHHRIDRRHHPLAIVPDRLIVDQAVDLISHIVQVLIHRRLPEGAGCRKGLVVFLAVCTKASLQGSRPIVHRLDQLVEAGVHCHG